MDRFEMLKWFEDKIGFPISEQDVRKYDDERRKVFNELIERGYVKKQSEETRIYKTDSSNKNAKKTIRDYYYIDKEKFLNYMKGL